VARAAGHSGRVCRRSLKIEELVRATAARLGKLVPEKARRGDGMHPSAGASRQTRETKMRDFDFVVEAGARVKAEHLLHIFDGAKTIRDHLIEACAAVEGELQPRDAVSEYLDFYADQLVEIELAAYDLGGAALLIKKMAS
jgi:hypothetical protein